MAYGNKFSLRGETSPNGLRLIDFSGARTATITTDSRTSLYSTCTTALWEYSAATQNYRMVSQAPEVQLQTTILVFGNVKRRVGMMSIVVSDWLLTWQRYDRLHEPDEIYRKLKRKTKWFFILALDSDCLYSSYMVYG